MNNITFEILEEINKKDDFYIRNRYDESIIDANLIKRMDESQLSGDLAFEVLKELKEQINKGKNNYLTMSDEDILVEFNDLIEKINHSLSYASRNKGKIIIENELLKKKETTIYRSISKFFTSLNMRAILDNKLDKAMFEKISSCLHKKLLSKYSEFGMKQKEEYLNKIYLRGDVKNTISIELDKYVKRAFETLNSIDLNEKKPNPHWIDVYMSIALCTGRRLTEISETGIFYEPDEKDIKFEKLKNNCLKFEGQLKTNLKSKTTGYLIYTLVPRELIFKGIEFLCKLGKKRIEGFNKYKEIQLYEDTKAFKDSEYYRSEFSKYIKSANFKFNVFGDEQAIKNISEIEKQNLTDLIDTKFNFRMFRALNASAIDTYFKRKDILVENKSFTGKQLANIVANQLGDKVQTLTSYERFHILNDNKIFYNGSEFI